MLMLVINDYLALCHFVEIVQYLICNI